jgi:hypothetical protein
MTLDQTYARLTQTTSMSFADRHEARRRSRKLAKGNTIDLRPAPEPPIAPRREGLRGKRYAFPKDGAPMLIVPHKVTSTARIPVDRLPGHEGMF